jgi:hypothetical protein
MNKSTLLFACHQGTSPDGTPIGNLSTVWPLALTEICPGSSYEDEEGIWALWEWGTDAVGIAECMGFAECIFGDAALSGPGLVEPGSLWVYEVEWESRQDGPEGHDQYTSRWAHLRGGDFRRPTIEELVQLTIDSRRPEAPWRIFF